MIGPKPLNRDLFDLTGKVAVVTGAAGIQGSRITRGLAGFGANIACIDILGDEAETLAGEIEQEYEVRAKGYACNVSVPEDVSSTVDSIVADLGGIDILHNNAAGKTENVFLASILGTLCGPPTPPPAMCPRRP